MKNQIVSFDKLLPSSRKNLEGVGSKNNETIKRMKNRVDKMFTSIVNK